MKPRLGCGLQRILHRLIAFQVRHPLSAVFITVALAAASIAFTLQNLTFQTNQRALMSHDRGLLDRLKIADRFSDRIITIADGKLLSNVVKA